MKISFSKLTAAGNDFILFDRSRFPGNAIEAGFITAICNRHFGIGADGVIFLSESDLYDFEMEYFNSDGSGGSLCANGARAALRFAELNFLKGKSKFTFSANHTEYSGEIIDNVNVKLNLAEPRKIRTGINLQHKNLRITGDFTDTGSPHFVADINGIINLDGNVIYSTTDEIEVNILGRELRNRKEFAPGGANINFVSSNGNQISIRTYERGVESETLACGTGSVAAAISVFLNGSASPPFSLITRGGEILTVDFEFNNSKFNNINLTGPAVMVFNGEIETEKFFNHIRSTNGKSDIQYSI